MKYEIRQLKKSPAQTLINVMGLALGCTSSLILFLLIMHGTGFDKYHKNRDQVYRVVSTSSLNGREDHTSGVAEPFIEAMKNDFPGVRVAPVNYIVGGRVIVDEDEQQIFEENEGIVFLDEQFYQLLDRSWIEGSSMVLSEPDRVVLSRKMALKYFNSLNVVGKSLEIEGVGPLVVYGVIEDYPVDGTDFPFDILVSFKTYEKQSEDTENWGSVSSDFQCYLLLNESQKVNVENNLASFADKYLGEDRSNQKQFSLQPLSDMHYSDVYSNYSFRSVTKGQLWAMGILGFFLIVTACVNFINLSTAQATQRYKAVGIKKILGSKKSQLVVSFFVETGIVVLVSMLLAVGLAELALFKVNTFLGLNLSIDYLDYRLWTFFVVLWLAVTMFSALYPSIIISNQPPHQAIKGAQTGKGVGYFLRKSLVVFQFAISQVLIVGTIITQMQLNFFKEMSVGFTKEGIINIEIPEPTPERKKALKQAVLQLSGIESASLSYRPPASTSTSVTNIFYQSEGEQQEMNTQIIPVDADFSSVYELQLLAGAGLNERDTINHLLVNETFVKEMGFTPQEAVGEMVHIWGQDRPIQGVVADFNTFSLASKIMPVSLFTNLSSYQQVAVKVRTGNVSNTMEDLKSTFGQLYPGYNFNYEFMDEQIALFYESEEKMSSLLMVFSGIAIFIGCLGLFGLVSYMANRKMKEIGIRKVLGASVFSVVFNFSKEFAILVFIAFLIAGPLAYLGMESWLQSYENKIELTPQLFLWGVLFSLFTALATISYKSITASLANPVHVLRDE